MSGTAILWNGDVLLSEERKNHKKLYIYEPKSFKPLAHIENNQCYFYHLDHLGTPQEITNWEGQVVWSGQYKAYGNLALQQVEEVKNNLRFQGQYYDQETGLHYNRHRYYDPSLGQFISQDPIGLLGGINNYQYAPNPTGWVDPFGLKCKEIEDMLNRVDAAIARHGGVEVDGGFMFPSKKAAKRAASEVLGDMGGDAKELPMSRYNEIKALNNPYREKKAEKNYGLVNRDGSKRIRDDFLGHPGFEEYRPLFNVEAWNSAPADVNAPGKPDLNLHFFYPESEVSKKNKPGKRK